MKKFMFCRLFETNHEYSYYVAPSHKTGALIKVVRSDLIDKSSKKILLQNDEEGRVILGVRQNLPLKDSVGRTRMNFTGYHIDSLDDLPYFDALSSQFEAIHEEAMESHSILEKNKNAGDKLRNTNIKFSKGNYNKNLEWDKAVKELRENPKKPVLRMFDDKGTKLGIPKEYLPPLVSDVKKSEPTIIEEPPKERLEVVEKKTAFSKKYDSKLETQSTTESMDFIDSLKDSTPNLKMIGKITSIGLIVHAGYNYYLTLKNGDEKNGQFNYDIKKGTLATAEVIAAIGIGIMSRGR